MLILAEDLAGVPLHQIENEVDGLVAKWRIEGCRFTAEVDRRGRRLNRKARPLSDAGINERLKLLRAVLGHAHMVAKVIPLRPRIRLLQVKRAAPGDGAPVRYFTAEERVRFLRYASPEVADFFQIAVLTGMRPAELLHLLVGSVDLRARKLTVQACACRYCPDGRWVPKTGNFRIIDIAPDLFPILLRLTADKGDEMPVITSQHGLPFARLPGGGGAFTRTLRRAGLDRKGLSLYSTRHTFAADLVTAGRPMAEVASLLGNGVRVCELHYGHLIPGTTAAAVETLKAVQPWPTSTAAADTTPANDRAPQRSTDAA